MSDVIINRATAEGESGIRQRLSDGMESMLQILDAGNIPEVTLCEELQNLIREYMESVSSGFSVKVIFQDVPAEGVRSEDVLEDIKRNPKAVDVLYKIGQRKIVAEEKLGVPEEQISWLKEHGYAAALPVEADEMTAGFLALTSKGWLCFRNKNITQQLQNTLGYSKVLLPDWLLADQTKWSADTWRRARLLHDYYMSTEAKGEYMIFSFPEDDRLLFGCRSGAQNEVVYECAVPENCWCTDLDQKVLAEVISDENVDRVTLVTTEKFFAENVLSELGLRPEWLEKVKIDTMERNHE